MALESVQDQIILLLENQKDVLSLPIKRSERIKYTCFTVSKSYVIFGATSGGLYVFRRNPCSFWQLIPSKESAITFVSVSQSENFIAFATSKSIVCILELNELNCKLVTRADDLSDSEITTLCWNDDVYKPTLYMGDKDGRVSFLKLSFLNKNILHLPTTVFMTLDSRVVQLCWQNEYLLASTITRCYLCDTVKETFKQIGQQLRDGYYGAAFLTSRANLRIFCARPGSRLWEVDLDATVHSTHQFKRPLAVPPSPFISIFNDAQIVEVTSLQEWSPQSFNFIKLYDLLGKYVVTYKKDALYVLNVETVSVLFWNNGFGEILDVCCISNTIFVWNATGDLYEFILLPINKCLLTLYLKQYSVLCVDVICRLYDNLTNGRALAELSPLCHLECPHLPQEKAQILAKFKAAIKSQEAINIELNSGIHVVNNKHFSSQMLDDSKLIASRKPRSLERSDSEEIRKRSHSLPSNLKKDESVTAINDESVFFNTGPVYENLYLETGLYNSPFLTLASYELVEDCISELSTSVSEKFSESSKSLKEKWRSVMENKLKFARSTKSKRLITADSRLYDSGVDIIVDEDIEPIVTLKKKPQVDADYRLIIEACEREDVQAIELCNLVVREYQSVAEKHGRKYEQFPFNMPEKTLSKTRKLFNQLLTSNSIVEWFEDESFPLIVEEEFGDAYPAILMDIFSREQLKLDFLLGRTLRIFSQLINASTILETVKSLKLPCYYLSFCYVMKYFQNNEILERNNYTKGNSNHWPLPVYLNTMLLMVSLDQVDVFCEMGLKKHVDCSDVIYMMLHLEDTEKGAASDKYKNICLIYLHRLCESSTFTFDNHYAMSLAVKIFSTINEKFEICCITCWFLLPGSPSTGMKFLQLGKRLLSLLWDVFLSKNSGQDLYSQEALITIRRSINDTTEYEQFVNFCYKNMESCRHVICSKLRKQITETKPSLLLALNIVCTFCHRVPELWNHLCTLQTTSPIKILHFEHFIQLGNINEVEANLHQGTVEEMRMILTLKSTLSDGFCLNCESKIPVNRKADSWNSLALFVLRRLGAKACLQLLNEFAERIKLEKSFFRSVILISIPGVNPDFMDLVTSASSSHDNIAPASANVTEELQETLKLDAPNRKFSSKFSNASHWGMAINVEDVNQTICYCCSLPLFSKYLIKEDNGGIMVFSCSHTYHTICLKNKNCTATCLVCDRFLR